MSRDRFLTAGVEIFEETGEFPTIKLVQRELEGWHDDTSARREAQRLPPSLGDLEGEQVRLCVRAIQRADPASALLEIFHAGLRVAVRNYRRRDRKATAFLGAGELIGRAGMSEFEAHQVLNMLVAERLVRKAGKAWEVMPAVRHYRSVKSADDYLRRRRKFERRQCRRQVLSKPLALIRRGLSKDGWARTLILSTLAILLAAFAVWVGSQVFGADDGGGFERNARGHAGKTSRGP